MVSCAIYKQAIMANAEDLLTLLSQLPNAQCFYKVYKIFLANLMGLGRGRDPLVVQ